MILQTTRLVVRPWTASDADISSAFAIYGDPEVTRYLFSGGPDGSIEQTRASMIAFVASTEPTSPAGSWAVDERASGRTVGTAIIKTVEMNGGEELEIGFHLARDAWGRGYATELARALIDYGFTVLHAVRLIGFAQPENAASIRVLEKAGMRQTGTGQFKGIPVVVYAIERDS